MSWTPRRAAKAQPRHAPLPIHRARRGGSAVPRQGRRQVPEPASGTPLPGVLESGAGASLTTRPESEATGRRV